jgi:16S rRNA (guanine527-N7)-methyltransferase
VAGLAERHGLPAGAPERLAALLTALAAEADPPTTVRAPERAADAHLADSLAGLEVDELRAARRIADLGAGAGFPGLPLAIALPGAQVDLIESSGRKSAVIGRLARAASADNARSVVARVEDWARAAPPVGGRGAYDAVTARALGPLAVLLEYSAPLLSEGGVMVAWKGARDPEEEAAGRTAAEQLGMTGETARPVKPFPAARNRHLYVFRKAGETPARFPRRAGMARKRPLGS